MTKSFFISKSTFQTLFIEVVATMLVWITCYKFSLWIFSSFEYNHEVFWVFLPAGVRILAVLMLGWRGVAGLFLGAIVTNDDINMEHVLLISSISALAPMAAMKFCKNRFHLPKTLNGLTVFQLLIFALVSSAFNSIFSTIYFHLIGIAPNFSNFPPMFIGDVIGTIIILVLASYTLHVIQAKIAG